MFPKCFAERFVQENSGNPSQNMPGGGGGGDSKVAKKFRTLMLLRGIVVSALAWHSLGRRSNPVRGFEKCFPLKTLYEVATVAMRG